MAVGLPLLGPAAARADVLSFQEGTGGFSGTLDTELNAGSPSTARGNNPSISVDQSPVSHGLIRFDGIFGNGAGQIPLGSTIHSASLTLNVIDVSTSAAVLSLHRMLTTWDESSTWSSLGSGIQTDDVEAASTADATFSNMELSGSQTITGLAGALQAWSDGGSNFGWALLQTVTDGWDFNTSELGTIGSRPELTVDFTSPTAAQAMRVASGSYVGDGIDNRGITGVGFAPDVVFVRADANRFTVVKTSTMAGDAAKELGTNKALATDRIQALGADGFTVGKNAQVNASGTTYYWVAFEAGAGELAVGTYTGDGVDNRNITGVGLQPSYMLVMNEEGQHSIHRFASQGFDASFEVRSGGFKSDRVQDLLPNGFQVGKHNTVNENGRPIHWIAWADTPSGMTEGTYVGNGNDNRAIGGIGFQPELAIVAGESVEPVLKPASLPGDASFLVIENAQFPNAIQSLDPDSFEVGTNAVVNQGGRSYFYVTFRGAPSADLEVAKTVDDPAPNEGGTINYQVVLTNTGPDPATNVQVTDLLPAGVTFVSATTTQGTYSDGTGIWDVASLAASASDTLTITATVDAGTGGTTIQNTASVTASDLVDGNAANDTASADIAVQSADLAVTKSVDDVAPLEGATIAYTVVLTNNGAATATGVQVTDLLPVGVTFQSGSATQGTYDDFTGIWDVGAVANAASDTLVITATVNLGTAGSTIVNTASVTASDQADPTPGNDSDSASIDPRVIEPAVIDAVQSGTATSTGTGTVTVPITTVDPSRSFLIFHSRHDLNRPPGSMVRGSIASSTTLEFTRVTDEVSTIEIQWYVVEYSSGVRVQRGEVAQSATLVDVALPSSVPALDQAFVTVSKTPGAPDGVWSADDPVIGELTSTSNLQIRASGANAAHIVSWQVIEFLDPADIHVQAGSITTMGTTNTSVTATLSPAVDPARTFVLAGFVVADGAADVGSRMLRAELTSSTTITIDRSIAGGNVSEIFWQAIELSDGSSVQHGSENFATGISQKVVPITAVDLSRSAAFSAVQPAGGQNMGRSPYALDDIIGVGSVTMDLSSPTQVTMDRTNNLDTTDIGWFVVEFGASPDADLEVTKTVDDAAPNEGATVSYTVVLANNGPGDATGVQVTDLLPSGVTYQSSAVTAGTYTPGTGLWSVGPVANAASDTLTITATVDAGTGGTTIQNTAAVTASDQADGNAGNDSATADITVQSVDLSITKAVDDPAPNEGGTINYEVIVGNAGPDAATGVEVTDILPAGVTFVSAAATQGSYVDSTGVWTVGSVAAAAADTLFITTTVDAGTAGTTIQNAAAVTASDQADGNAANDTDTADITVMGVDLGITKAVDDPAPNEGATINYEVVLSNAGPDTATNVQVTDLLPAGVTFVSSATTQGAYADSSGIWDLTSIAASASDTLTITATVDAGTGGTTIQNTASVTASDQADGNPANDSGTADITVQSVDLSITKAVDDPAPNEGGTINYEVIVGNAGPDAATGVEVTDILPAGVTFVSAAATQGSYVDSTGVWTVGSVAAAAADTLFITTTVDAGTAGTTIQNAAAVTASDQADGNAANDTDTADITVMGVDLGITKAVDDPAPNEGATINYEVVLSNAGPDTATNVQVTDLLPAGVTFVSSAATQGTYDDGTGIWDVASIAGPAADTLFITATVDAGTAGTTIQNTASVTASDQADGNAGNDSDTADITVMGAGADLSVTKTVDDVTPIEGATIAYTVVLSNGGPDAATGVALTDLLPAGVTFVGSSTTQGTYDDGTGIWTVGTVGPAASDTLVITATVDPLTGGTTILNTASVTASDPADGNPANDSDTASITVKSPGANETQITSDPASDQRPTWSPDGTKLGFDSDRSGNQDVWTVPVSGGTATRITPGNLFDQHPDWSSDGTQFVFAVPSVGGGLLDLYLIPATGGSPTLLAADSTTNDRFPAWSPDGSQIAFTKDADIYVIPAAGGVPVQITTDPGSDVHPSWSPDGTQLAFLSDRSGNNDIWVIPSIGGAATQLTTDPGNDGAPDWSPDGTRIAFQSTRSGNNDIWIIPSTGGAATQITTDPGIDVQPDWSPSGNQLAFARDGNLWVFSFPGASSADLALTKAVDDPTPEEAQAITYTIVLANNGPDRSIAEVTDLLPAGVTFQSATPTQGSYDEGSGIWTVGLLDNLASATLTITATVDLGTGGTTIGNTASVTGSDRPDPNAADNSDSADITVEAPAAADLSVAKTVDDPAPSEGGLVVYTVILANGGPDPAGAIQVTDLLPAGVTFVTGSATQGTYDDGTGVWGVGSVAASASDTLTISASVDVGTQGTMIVNTASITASDAADPNAANDSDTATIVVQVGGPSEVQITDDPANDQRPSWSPDETTIAFDSDRAGNTDIWTVASTGGAVTQVTTSTRFDLHPDWSPNDSLIVYISPPPAGGLFDLWLIPPTGGAPTVLAADSTANDRFPTWSPDGTQVAYAKDGDIYVIPASGGSPTALTTGGFTTNEQHPTWSPDGTQIAFVSDALGNNDIFVIPATGGMATAITSGFANDGAPDWSPDGTLIAYQTNLSGNTDIWVVPATGGTSTQVTTFPGFDVQPDWSPSGNRIAFARDGNIWIANYPPGLSTDLAVTKLVDNPTPAEGSTVTYTVVLTNNGPDMATGNEVTDLLPGGLTFVSSGTTQGSYDSGSGIWSAIAALASGSSDTLTIVANVDLGVGDTTIVNTASVTATDQPDPNAANDSDSVPITVTSVVGVEDLGAIPSAFALGKGRPNPFRDRMTISFDVPSAGFATLSIWDVSGRRVRTLVNRVMAAGRYAPAWDGRDDQGRLVSAGVYFVRLEAGSHAATRKLTRLR